MHATFQPLTREEIDRRIQHVVSEMSLAGERSRSNRVNSGTYRFISTADLVRRMRPYLVFN
jgi:hypothetical protein